MWFCVLRRLGSAATAGADDAQQHRPDVEKIAVFLEKRLFLAIEKRAAPGWVGSASPLSVEGASMRLAAGTIAATAGRAARMARVASPTSESRRLARATVRYVVTPSVSNSSAGLGEAAESAAHHFWSI